jgi:signal transduction histidine kinase
MESDLQQRIPLHGASDEWDQLAANLNSMLDRIEFLMGEVKQVGDNIAHDLRTPLTRMRARLERTSLRLRNAETIRRFSPARSSTLTTSFACFAR